MKTVTQTPDGRVVVTTWPDGTDPSQVKVLTGALKPYAPLPEPESYKPLPAIERAAFSWGMAKLLIGEGRED